MTLVWFLSPKKSIHFKYPQTFDNLSRLYYDGGVFLKVLLSEGLAYQLISYLDSHRLLENFIRSMQNICLINFVVKTRGRTKCDDLAADDHFPCANASVFRNPQAVEDISLQTKSALIFIDLCEDLYFPRLV